MFVFINIETKIKYAVEANMEGLTNWPDIISDSGDIITLIILNFYMSAIP